MSALDFPDTPTVGQLYGSSGTMWRWDGARWASTAGASGARGRVAYAQVTTVQGSITGAQTLLTGLSVTWNAVPGRVYRTSWHCDLQGTIAPPQYGYIKCLDGAGNQIAQTVPATLNNSYGTATDGSITETGLSGGVTRSLAAQLLMGGTSMSNWAAPFSPSWILVEDITYEAGSSGGPVPAPWVSYPLQWFGSSGNPGMGNSDPVKARSRLDGDMVDLYIYMNFGSTVNGGAGQLSFNLPYASSSEHIEQFLTAKLYHPNGDNYHGYAYIAAGSSVVVPFFSASATIAKMGGWAGANASAQPGTGIPTIASQYTVLPGGNVTVMGRYRRATS